MAGIEEQPDVGADQRFRKVAHDAVHAGLVEVATLDHLEAEALERSRHVGGVVARIFQLGGVAVGGIADDERDALLGLRGRAQ